MQPALAPRATAGPGTFRQLLTGWLPALCLALALGFVAKAPEFVLPMGPDQGTYLYVAERILEGGAPYRDAWDNKPPATYYLHAGVLALLPPADRWDRWCIPGLHQPCGYFALHVVDLVWTAATALALFALARRVTGRTSVALAASSLFALHANLSQLSSEGSTPEKQLLLPLVLAYLAIARWQAGQQLPWLGAAGLLAGVAFLFKQTAVSIPLALGAWWVWEQWASGRHASPLARLGAALPSASVFLAGFLAPLVLASAFLATRGALGAFWEAAFVYNLAQASASPFGVARGFAAGAWRVFSRSSALLWLLALGGALQALGHIRQRPLTRLVLCWALADLLSLFLGGSKFAQVYFVQLVPSFALLAALALESAWELARGRMLARAYLGILVLGVFLVSNSLQAQVAMRAWNDRIPPRSSVPPEHLLALELQGQLHATPGPLFVWGDATQVYVLANGQSPSRFFHVFPLSGFFVGGSGYVARRAELLRALEDNPPHAIVVDPRTSQDDPDGSLGLKLSSFPELERFIAARYRAVDEVDVGGGWKAYKRRDLDPPKP
ncbi:MAG: glycosyltransferase family 39 protein [Chloroflexi bacterium]|nr:glycosyltransferase family 39 protein [Chloroflexota bacterium]